MENLFETQEDFQLPTVNTIYQDKNESTTTQINKIVKEMTSVILVVDESLNDIYDELVDYSNTSIYDIGKARSFPNKIVISLRKFAILVRQGIVKKDVFEFVIFRFISCNKEIQNTFKIFYLKDTSIQTKKALVLTFMRQISINDHIYLQSYMHNNEKDNKLIDPKNSVVNIFASPQENQALNEYMFYKSHLVNILNEATGDKKEACKKIYKDITEMEHLTFKYGLYHLKKIYGIDCTHENIKYTYDCQLLINDYKYRRLLEIICKYEGCYFYIKSEIDLLIQYVKVQVKDSINMFPYNDQTKVDRFKNSILVVYDGVYNGDTNMFYKTFIFNEYKNKENIKHENVVCQIQNYNQKSDKIDFYSFYKYMNEKLNGFEIKESGAFIEIDYASCMFQHIVSLILHLLKENYCTIRENLVKFNYIECDSKFCCIISIPPFHNEIEDIESSYENTKKCAQKDAALKFIMFLFHKKIIDKYLFPIKETLINRNQKYFYRIFRYYKLMPVKKSSNVMFSDSIIQYEFKESMEDNFTISKEFMLQVARYGFNNDKLNEQLKKINEDFYNHKNIFNLKRNEYSDKITTCPIQEDKTNLDDTSINRHGEKIQPDCLRKYSNDFYCYCFKDLYHETGSKIISTEYQLGICTGESFTEVLVYNNIQSSFICKINFNEEQVKSLILFQVILCNLYFRKIKENIKNGKNYSYLIVPIKNGKLDFEFIQSLDVSRFFIGDVYQNLHNTALLEENFLYNPFINKFFCYGGSCERSIDEIDRFGDVFTSFKDYYEEKYQTKLLRTTGDDLLFLGYMFDKKLSSIPCILSTEILQITSIKRNIGIDFEKFSKGLFAFEKCALAYQFKQKHDLKLKTQIIIQCFTSKDDSSLNYECLEFLGDCILKYVSLKNLFLTLIGDINDFVKAKDYFISNDYLYNIAKNLEITEYYSFMKYCDSIFQPPSLYKYFETLTDDLRNTGCEYINYFKSKETFLSSNASKHESKFIYVGDKIKGAKTYADIIEALIGAYFIENGLKCSENFIYEIGIISNCSYSNTIVNKNIKEKLISNIPAIKNTKVEHPNVYDDICALKSYKNILPLHEIERIQNILNYKFKYPGLIEKIMIHPSYGQNVFGSVHFNKLELIGDAAIDLTVTIKIYDEKIDQDPESLHCRRKSLVNNFTLARVLFKTKLIDFLRIRFEKNYIAGLKEKLSVDGQNVNKGFGDVFEGICGAILLDMDINIERFQEYFTANLFCFLEECKDITR